jgi:hypothetical protein
MRSATIQEIKQELQDQKAPQLISLCLRLARFKKENKELLTYLLFEASDEQGYVNGIKQEVTETFTEINLSQLYFAKKTLRRILRMINKYVRYSGQKQTEIELRLHYCTELKNSGIPLRQNPVISNLYDGQLRKIKVLMSALHEDLQHDYKKELEPLLDETGAAAAKSWNPFKRKSKK